jgi:hypothetical protein
VLGGWPRDESLTRMIIPLDEQDRVPLDDFEPRFLRHSITLLHKQDQHTLMTDNSLIITGCMQTIIPTRHTAARSIACAMHFDNEWDVDFSTDAAKEDAASCCYSTTQNLVERWYTSTSYSCRHHYVVRLSAFIVVPSANAATASKSGVVTTSNQVLVRGCRPRRVSVALFCVNALRPITIGRK